jgi:HK97 family phage major capsid protein
MRVLHKAIDEVERTVEVAFSSDAVIQDWPGHYHKLSHEPGAADLSRLNNGAAVLVNHNSGDQVGVVVRAWIDSDDRVGRAVLRFGKSDRAQEIFQDVVDGIRQHISVGAEIVGSIEREEKDGCVILHVGEWAPTEISLAAVPADTKVGIGRTREALPKQPKKDPIMEPEIIDKKALEKDVLTRLNEIYTIGREYGCEDLAAEYATNGKTSEREIIELNRKALDHYLANQEEQITRAERGESTPVTAIGLSSNEVQRFSIMRALDAYLSNNWKGAEFEKKCSDEIARVLDREPNGVFIPHEIQTRSNSHLTRDMSTDGAGVGQEFVGTRLDPSNFIEQLRVTTQAARLGARMLPGLRQNLTIPKKTAASTFAWLAERGTVTLSDLGTGLVSLGPKTVGGGIEATRRMLKQSTPAMDDMMMSDLVEGAGEIIDLGAFQGSGAANQPTGIVNQSGVNTQIVNPAGQPTWGEIVGFETAVAADNALRGALGWATTSGVVGYLKTTEKASGTGRFIMDNEGGMFGGRPAHLNGYPVGVQNQLDAGRMIFGNFNELLIGLWGVLDLRPDPYTNASSDGLIIRAFQDIDIAVRHGESFCINVLT